MSSDRIKAFNRKLPFPVLPTNIPGLFISTAWSKDFDLATASPSALMKQGVFWRRPGPGDDPR